VPFALIDEYADLTMFERSKCTNQAVNKTGLSANPHKTMQFYKHNPSVTDREISIFSNPNLTYEMACSVLNMSSWALHENYEFSYVAQKLVHNKFQYHPVVIQNKKRKYIARLVLLRLLPKVLANLTEEFLYYKS
jgi:hypothetical protein